VKPCIAVLSAAASSIEKSCSIPSSAVFLWAGTLKDAASIIESCGCNLKLPAATTPLISADDDRKQLAMEDLRAEESGDFSEEERDDFSAEDGDDVGSDDSDDVRQNDSDDVGQDDNDDVGEGIGHAHVTEQEYETLAQALDHLGPNVKNKKTLVCKSRTRNLWNITVHKCVNRVCPFSCRVISPTKDLR
jgi:hypothetical protein